MSTALGHASADRETKWPMDVPTGKAVAGVCGYDATFTCHARTRRGIPYKAARAPVRRAFAVKLLAESLNSLSKI